MSRSRARVAYTHAAAVTAALCLGAAAPASLIDGADFAMYGAEFDAFGDFYSVDVEEASVTTIGRTTGFLASLDFTSSGVLYSASNFLDTVDPATGQSLSSQFIQFSGGPGSDIISGLAISAEGEAYGIGNGNGNLWRIDLETAEAEYVGSSGAGLFSLEFGADGTLYGAGFELWEISTTDGGAELIGGITKSSGGLSPAGFDLIGGLDFAPNGVMYGASSGLTDDSLYSIDLETGTGTLIGVTGGDLVAIASVPGVGGFALLALPGILARRRRQ